MHHNKRTYRLGKRGQLKAVSETKNEKYIPVPAEILQAWNRTLDVGDKKRISLTQNLVGSEITHAFRGYASPQTIDKINRYFDISRSSIPKILKIKVA